jgi:hypothetical protein
MFEIGLNREIVHLSFPLTCHDGSDSAKADRYCWNSGSVEFFESARFDFLFTVNGGKWAQKALYFDRVWLNLSRGRENAKQTKRIPIEKSTAPA